VSRNDEVARRLELYADFEEAMGEEYKPQTYRRAADNVRSHPRAVEDLAAEGPDAVAEIDGVGDAIAEKVVEYVDTGEIAELTALREELPVEMAALTRVEGVGPRTVKRLYDALGVTTLDELEAAARDGEIAGVSGFGEKTQANILENVAFAREARERQLLGHARPLGEAVREELAGVDAAERVALAGSLRRWTETVGDVDVLVATTDPGAVVDAFVDWRDADVIEAGTTKASVRTDGVRVDLRSVDPSEFGAALQYFTGSKAHNIHVRNLAIERGLKLNEYGVFDVSDLEGAADDERAGERLGGATEAEMYDALDLPVVPPELREDRGEVEAATEGRLPELVSVGDVRGDLHTHTDRSDGRATLSEMLDAAEAFGHDYYAVTDHGVGPGVVGDAGLDADDLRDQRAELEAAAEGYDLEVFHGVEANVDADGDVVPGGDVLGELDVVVASPHSGLRGGDDATDRLVAAVEHPSVDVLGHPTGRLINERPGLEVDVSRLAEAAAGAGTALEVNADFHRLDLNGEAVRAAVDAGATVAVNTDAHAPGALSMLRYGVHTARRGWAEAADVLNARDADGVRAFLS
jgi:DNA polymerase (family 10)